MEDLQELFKRATEVANQEKKIEENKLSLANKRIHEIENFLGNQLNLKKKITSYTKSDPYDDDPEGYYTGVAWKKGSDKKWGLHYIVMRADLLDDYDGSPYMAETITEETLLISSSKETRIENSFEVLEQLLNNYIKNTKRFIESEKKKGGE